MIALLRGEVAIRRADHVVLLCDGVGYRAAVSAETLRRVPPVGEPITLHTHLIAREDALTLYGFYTEQERDLFLMLLAVQSWQSRQAARQALDAGDVERALALAIEAQAIQGTERGEALRLLGAWLKTVGASSSSHHHVLHRFR